MTESLRGESIGSPATQWTRSTIHGPSVPPTKVNKREMEEVVDDIGEKSNYRFSEIQ
jgi:hypothetical protein